jgi:hypothetical protein
MKLILCISIALLMSGAAPMQAACFRQLDLAPFDLLFWPHPLVSHHSAPVRSGALRRP